jgi:ABC-type polysaccharide/polyol phosphate export permease
VQLSRPSNLSLALQDLKSGVCSIYIWPMLGWQEIRQRYRRSLLGPFWLTISTGMLIGAMGPLYGRLLGQDVSTYFPYLAISFVAWMLISSMLNELCLAFIGAEGFIKQIKLPLTIHVLRVVWRNLIVFAHNLVIVALVLLFFPPPITANLLLFPVALFLIAVNAIWAGILIGLMCARFRDIPQIVTSLMQVALFLTPVMWKADMLGRNIFAAEINPFFHFLEIIRQPLLGGAIPAVSWIVVASITVCGYSVAIVVFAKFRARIAYWV